MPHNLHSFAMICFVQFFLNITLQNSCDMSLKLAVKKLRYRKYTHHAPKAMRLYGLSSTDVGSVISDSPRCVDIYHLTFYRFPRQTLLLTPDNTMKNLGLLITNIKQCYICQASGMARRHNTMKNGANGTSITCGFTWASYQIRKIASCACAGNDGNVFPDTYFTENC